MKHKVKIAIFDLTDCEGCELQFLAFVEKVLEMDDQLEITNWRLAKQKNVEGPFDVAFIEGSPLTEEDIELIKEIKKHSKAVVALGNCASLAGIPGLINGEERERLAKKIYGPNYKLRVREVRPLSHYIDVDYELRGCPVTEKELEELVSSLISGKKVVPKTYPVCLECKANGNPCLFLENKACLGAVTKGGCGALCPSHGHRCYGCLGPVRENNTDAITNRLSETVGKDEAIRQLEIFVNNPMMEEK
ncbi:TPA: hypothetical protein DDW69_04480 [candidate division CPR2 bacterium]|uniref:NADH ubiquinone oxidoreductase, 20 Kd subunit family n=1 Tax=candidate division CPR2 bacterium GW2011_GWC1_41_48 TaxID=1618344 RepID=A0A0G0W8J2_UNCC2|nr:MAG: NADH ubiquinone oxidoreductase, 20 Kd subunit family [candidate division CPR2 bacterium GW2011_GWC2_39_35]KKR28333.1 MAG: NADH ubiquinone oxidoreductase, 20 Kd subunit family [candidate division CPR2 bacterium GW2011_GWD1_39_7]KKR29084.1 MAG: NADH ubiquinone oxidoreductase, 20 Kd subunit family [candidate division CPR2 bacterium GW2011_GWD2_39_7]KKS09300.1 MAG: NADH ubiquinone oxidoreductase, 20 Kd subunit family [candidate division CPR2 bacterium GW2011_GWC1_41_48]OGB60575.1 MAG: hypot